MANCKYILGGKIFNSEIELDDYLSEIKDLHKSMEMKFLARNGLQLNKLIKIKSFHRKNNWKML